MAVHPRQTAAAPASERGFTLLELVLVLLLLALAYGLAGPMLSEKPAGMELRSATRQLAAGLRKARNEAITHRREAVLTLDMETRTFSISGDPKVYALPQPLSYSLYTATSETSHGRVGGIRFFSDGSSTGGRISIGAANGTRLAVEVDWLTGRVATP